MASECRQTRNKGVFMRGQLKLSAYMNHGLVTVHIMQARQLTSMGTIQPDTFVLISLIPETPDVTPTRCRTGLARHSSCPTFNEKFSFEVGDDDLHKRLLVTLWTRDSNSRATDLYGCMSFGIHHLHSGNRPVSGWYHLLTEDVGCKKHRKVTIKERPAVPVMQSRERHLSSSSREHAHLQIPSVNSDIHGVQRLEMCVYRSPYGGFGFTVIGSCPVKIGRIDSISRAEEAGLQQGDIVIRVNGQNVSRSTSVSVARCIKRSGDMVHLELHRPQTAASSTSGPTLTSIMKGGNSDSDENNSVQDFTIFDDKTALLHETTGLDTRRQAAFHRLLCMEENFVEMMNAGIQKYSRPLRHCIVTGSQHAALFQNIEKLVCMSQYQVRQILDNLPSNVNSDDDSDTSFSGDSDLTSVVAMIYLAKLPVLQQGYTLYISGLHRASQVLSALETRADFRHFLLGDRSQGRQLSLCDFINRPLSHIQDLCDLIAVIHDTTTPHTYDHQAFRNIVSGLSSVLSSVKSAVRVTSSLVPDHHLSTSQLCNRTARTGSGLRRRVPFMGSLVLKSASSATSVTSSSSGFGSGSSQSSDVPASLSDTDSASMSDAELRGTLV